MVSLRKLFPIEKEFELDNTVDENIPWPFEVNRKRNMPIAKFLGTDGYFLFPSENSYDVYKQNNNEIGRLDAEGVGIPLLHISLEFPTLGNAVGNSPSLMVWKYILLHAGEAPPPIDHKVVRCGSKWTLYKVPFCEIYRKWSFNYREYRFTFPYDRFPMTNLTLKRTVANRDLYTYMGEVSLRWHVPMPFLVDTDHYTLQILDDSVPNLLDDSVTTNRKKRLKTDRKFIEIARYTREDRDMMPHRTSKRANLYIGEWSSTTAYGIAEVPWTTQVLACHGLLIHYIEHQRREGGGQRRGRSTQLPPQVSLFR
ncbi:hypothetical protein HG536_0H04840 [Torulaspora globosa]|uniref:Uncharacterized protein n=1 Tax=Torulaspora globosa TaxID=48254 RepID=A0A7G3ZNM2_9SACH|nr:uncharacterized protein HG536_0H04840 [Torulaspora globosa]QLL35108.1 hypothetical protein HG536_0H04840 [Torulaspora globosa]